MASIASRLRSLRRHAGGGLLLLLSLLAPGGSAFAQHEYDTWYFGFARGLSFNSGDTAVYVNNSAMGALQGCAIICNAATGALLFYTNGNLVWNHFDQPMVNGIGLDGAASAAQAALIVPRPDDPNIYYIFTTDASEDAQPPNGYHYSIVDMARNGGLGDVTTKNVALTDECSEHQTAVRHCNGRDFWVIAHSIEGNSFYAFPVTAAGVGTTPVISPVGYMLTGHGSSYGSSPQGVMKASPDGTTLVMTYGTGVVELYRFDRGTGRIHDPITLYAGNQPFYHYGASFSPDSKKLYVSGESGLTQYSLESGDPATMAASRTLLSSAPGSDLQLGPDGRIYRRSGNGIDWDWISVINAPNKAGAACGVIDRAIHFGNTTVSEASYGLPNNIDALHLGLCMVKAVIGQSATGICLGESVTFDAAGSIGSSREWSFDGGTPASSNAAQQTVIFTTPGAHGIRLVVRDGSMVDSTMATVEVFAPPALDLGPDRYLCPDQCITLTPRINGGTAPFTYAWSPSAGLDCIDCASPQACPKGTTAYHLTVTDAHGCSASDSVTLYDSGPYIGHLHAPRDLTVPPGEVAEVPILLDDSLDLNAVGTLRLTLRYDSTMMRLLPESSGNGRTDGTLLDGWSVETLLDIPGTLTLQLTPPPGLALARRNGTVVRLRFATFITAGHDSAVALASELPLEAEPSDACVILRTDPGRLGMTLCGLSYRMIEMTASTFAIKSIGPNPFGATTEIRFSLGLDGPARVEITDVAGHSVATLLDRYLQPGSYSLVWDAGSFPSGLYYCRVSAGTWTEVRELMLRK